MRLKRELFSIEVILRHAYVMSPKLFNIDRGEAVMKLRNYQGDAVVKLCELIECEK